MNKVLTINIPFTTPWALPYGLAVVNGILKADGYDVEAWDLSIEFANKYKHLDSYDKFYGSNTTGGYINHTTDKLSLKKFTKLLNNDIKKKLQQSQPDIVLLSVFSSQSLDLAVPVATWVRKFLPNAYIMIGGRGLDNTERVSRLNYGEFFARYLPIDLIYMGDAETDLVQVLKDRPTGVHRSRPVGNQDLVSVPNAYWHGLDFNQYQGYKTGDLRMPFVGSKGCVRQCTFCDVAASWPKYVYRKGNEIAEELIDIYNQYGISKIEFTDNLINGSITNFRAMNTVLAERLPNTLDYVSYAICRPKNEFPERDFELASIAGAKKFKIGIESGSERIRNDMKKKFSNEDIDWMTINCAKYNIHQIWLMFCGYPNETEEDFQATLDLLEKYKHLAQQGKISVFLSLPMMLTDGSGFMHHHAERYGLEHNRDENWSDFFWTSTKYTDNTFEVRAARWRRFYKQIVDCGYDWAGGTAGDTRQSEKILEISSLETKYQEYLHAKKQKNIGSFDDRTINIRKDTHI